MRRHNVSLADTAEPIGGINTTPLIDVLLVLLVMFIITIPIQLHEIPLNLPQPGPATTDRQIAHLMEIGRDGAVMLDGTPVDRSSLEAKLSSLRADPSAALQLKTDPRARYDDFAQTLSIIKRAGITRLGFVGNTPLK